MADFNKAYDHTIKAEGGFRLTNNKGDIGGYTYAGISRKYHPTWAGWATVDALVKQGKLVVGGKAFITPELEAQVKAFYKAEFWDLIRGDELTSQRAAEFIFDFGVNAGLDDAVPAARIVVGIKPGPSFGPLTRDAINKTPEKSFIADYYKQVVAHYDAEVKRKPSQQQFYKGWINRANSHLI